MSKRKIRWGSNTPDNRFAGSGFRANSAEFTPSPVNEANEADFSDSNDFIYDNIPNYRGDKYGGQ